MSSFFKPIFSLLVCATVSVAAPAQLLPTPSKTTESATQSAADPLGRDTPSGTIYGFLQAAQSGSYSIASQYLQMTNARRATQGEELATQLKAVMDRAFSGNLRLISNRPEGTPQDGVSSDRQRIGTLSAGDVDAELSLIRVSDPGGAKIWLISSDTLAKVPELYDRLEERQMESHLPNFLVRNELFGMPIWQWLGMLLAIPFAAGVGWLLIWILGLFQKLRRRQPPRATAWSATRFCWRVFRCTGSGADARRRHLSRKSNA